MSGRLFSLLAVLLVSSHSCAIAIDQCIVGAWTGTVGNLQIGMNIRSDGRVSITIFGGTQQQQLEGTLITAYGVLRLYLPPLPAQEGPYKVVADRLFIGARGETVFTRSPDTVP